jgi:hypothetical protein
MGQFSQTNAQFDFLVEVKKDEEERIKAMQFRRLGEYPVHSSLLEENELDRSAEHPLKYDFPVKVRIEYGVVLSFSTAQVTFTGIRGMSLCGRTR